MMSDRVTSHEPITTQGHNSDGDTPILEWDGLVVRIMSKDYCRSKNIQVYTYKWNKMLWKLNYYKLSLKFDTSKFIAELTKKVKGNSQWYKDNILP
jgi:hypothetical protein